MSNWYMGELARQDDITDLYAEQEALQRKAFEFPKDAISLPPSAPELRQQYVLDPLKKAGRFISDTVSGSPWLYPSAPEAPGAIAEQPTYDPNLMGLRRTTNAWKPISGEGRVEDEESRARSLNPYWGLFEAATNVFGPTKAGLKAAAVGVPILAASTTEAEAGPAGKLGGAFKPFFSAVERAFQGAKQDVAPGTQWLGWLRNQPGIKPDEISHMGLERFLSRPEPLSKQSVLDYVGANKLELGETVKGTGPKWQFGTDAEQQAALERYNTAHAAIINESPGTPQWRAVADEFQNAQTAMRDIVPGWGRAPGGADNPTRHEQWVMPGGENYSETLLTMPPSPLVQQAEAALTRSNTLARQTADMMSDWKRLSEGRPPGDPEVVEAYQRLAEVRRQRDAAEHEYRSLRAQNRDTQFKSSHYDEPNILAHYRTNERTIGDKKALFLEEVQSDWHQAGRAQGYKQKQEPHFFDRNDEGGWDVRDGRGNVVERVRTQQEAQDAAINRTAEYSSGVPDAPFKTTWPEVALKRALAEAAEKGFDKLAWTPGSVQNARYDLSKHISDIRFEKSGSGGFDSLNTIDKQTRGVLTARDHRGKVVMEQFMEADELADHIGKEAAEKLLAQEPAHTSRAGLAMSQRRLSGLDLQVGGEGMVGFYDKMLPSVANKLIKKYGGRVGQEPLDRPPQLPTVGEVVPQEGGGWKIQWSDGTHSGGYGSRNNAEVAMRLRSEKIVEQNAQIPETVHSIDINDQLREAAKKGFPLFSLGGAVATGGAAMGGLAATTGEAEAGRLGPLVHGITDLIRPESLTELVKRQGIVRGKDIPEKVITPHDLEPGSWFMPLPGDRSRSGDFVTHVAGRELDTPVWTQGGFQYMPEHADKGVAWASYPGVVSKLASKVDTFAERFPNVYGAYSGMGMQSVDFSHHMSDTLSQMMRSHKRDISQAATEKFDKVMRDALPKGAPDWPGVKSERVQDYLREMPGKYKDLFAKTMATKGALDAGFPDVTQARIAVTHPSLLNEPPYAGGASLARLRPEAIHNPFLAQHGTYRSKLGGEYVGGFGQSVPAEVLWPAFTKEIARRDPSAVGKIWQTGLTSTPYGAKITPQWQDRVAEWLRKNPMGSVAQGAY